MGSSKEAARALAEPGGHARARGLELNKRLLAVVVASLIAILAAWLLGFRGVDLTLIALAAIAAMLGANRLYSPQIERWLQGAKGERDVAAVLAELEADGWQSLHDISLGRGNIDHILVGPGGLFTIETKSHRGRIGVDGIRPEMLKQAYAQKKLLERITDLDVQPLLVFSQAYLIGSVPARRKGVVILPARTLKHYLSRQRPTLSEERASQIHRRLGIGLQSTNG